MEVIPCPGLSSPQGPPLMPRSPRGQEVPGRQAFCVGREESGRVDEQGQHGRPRGWAQRTKLLRVHRADSGVLVFHTGSGGGTGSWAVHCQISSGRQASSAPLHTATRPGPPRVPPTPNCTNLHEPASLRHQPGDPHRAGQSWQHHPPMSWVPHQAGMPHTGTLRQARPAGHLCPAVSTLAPPLQLRSGVLGHGWAPSACHTSSPEM